MAESDPSSKYKDHVPSSKYEMLMIALLSVYLKDPMDPPSDTSRSPAHNTYANYGKIGDVID